MNEIQSFQNLVLPSEGSSDIVILIIPSVPRRGPRRLGRFRGGVTLGPNVEHWSFDYNTAGRGAHVVYPDGHVRVQQYDDEGRLSSRCYRYGSAQHCYTATYDGHGKPARVGTRTPWGREGRAARPARHAPFPAGSGLPFDSPSRPHRTRRGNRLTQGALQIHARARRVTRPLATVAQGGPGEGQVIACAVDQATRDPQIE